MRDPNETFPPLGRPEWTNAGLLRKARLGAFLLAAGAAIVTWVDGRARAATAQEARVSHAEFADKASVVRLDEHVANLGAAVLKLDVTMEELRTTVQHLVEIEGGQPSGLPARKR